MNVLVIESSPEARDLIVLLLESQFHASSVEASNSAEALNQLKKNGSSFQAVICGFSILEQGKLVLKRCTEMKIPVILCDFHSAAPNKVPSEYPIFGIAKKPKIIPSLRDHLNRLKQATHDDAAEIEFCKIKTSVLLRLSFLRCDAYIKINESKFVKVMKENDLFEKDDLYRFESKKIEHLYLKTEDAKKILDRLAQNLTQITENDIVELEPGVRIATTTLEILSDFNQVFGFQPEVTELAHASVGLAVKTMKENPELSALYSRLTVNMDQYLASHSVILAHLCCGISSLMGWKTDEIFYKFSLAAFLHDLTLGQDELAKVHSIEELKGLGDKFSEADRKRFTSHPVAAAKLADEIPNLSSDVGTIIRQHHENPEGNGFPKKSKSPQIHPLSAIFIVAEKIIEFRIKICSNLELEDFLDTLSPAYQNNEPFNRIIEALRASQSEQLKAQA